MLFGATRTEDGRALLPDEERAIIPILACIECPTSFDVVGHNGRVCRFSGWAVSNRGRSVTVRACAADGPLTEVPADRPRPDVVESLRGNYDVQRSECGFGFYVDLPPINAQFVPVTIEMSDGEYVATTGTFRAMRDVDLRMLDTYLSTSEAKRHLSHAYLRGRGVEFGALHLPLPVDESCQMHYVDRLTKAEAVETFPELREHFAHEIVEPDFIVDLDTDDLRVLEPHGFDFFVANDVIEHLPNPIQFLEHVYAVTRPGALFFLSAPDRDYTFDVTRALTSEEHLWQEYSRGETTVSTEHLRDFIRNTEPGGLPMNPLRRPRLYKFHRDRSIHVHVWNQQSFDHFLDAVFTRLGLGFETVARARSRDADGNMIYILRKCGGAGPPATPHLGSG